MRTLILVMSGWTRRIAKSEYRMVIMGMSSLHSESRGQETARSKRINNAESDSQIALHTRSTNDGAEEALRLTAKWMDIDRPTDGGRWITLSSNFGEVPLDASMIRAYVGMFKAGFPVHLIIRGAPAAWRDREDRRSRAPGVRPPVRRGDIPGPGRGARGATDRGDDAEGGSGVRTLITLILVMAGWTLVACESDSDRLERLREEQAQAEDRVNELRAQLDSLHQTELLISLDEELGREVLFRHGAQRTADEIARSEIRIFLIREQIDSIQQANWSDPKWQAEDERLKAELQAAEDRVALIERDIRELLR